MTNNTTHDKTEDLAAYSRTKKDGKDGCHVEELPLLKHGAPPVIIGGVRTEANGGQRSEADGQHRQQQPGDTLKWRKRT